MIYDSQSLKIKFKDYKNINQKISIDTINGKLYRIKRGLYTDDISRDYPLIANVCYAPSYISFEYALSYYGMIPEYVSLVTSAVYGKKNNKFYFSKDVSFEYRSIPNEVFSEGIIFLKTENGLSYKFASREKALCDTLYSKYPVRTKEELKRLLFDDLRIDEEELRKLDFEFIEKIAIKYHSNTLKILVKYLMGEYYEAYNRTNDR